MLDLAITGGTCVLPSGTQAADIGVKDGRIVLVGRPGTLPEAVRSVSAGDRLVIPGGIDPHIHCGLEWKVSGQPAVFTDPAGNRVCLYRAGEVRRFPPWRLNDS